MPAPRCRWCGTVLPYSFGRPPVWCGDVCRDRHDQAFRTRNPWGAAVHFVEVCDGACTLDGTVQPVRGSVVAPGAWAEAVAATAAVLHGHEVAVRVLRAETGYVDTGGSELVAPVQRTTVEVS